MADFVTDGKIGVDLTATYASTSAGSSIQWPASPGTTVHTNNAGRYIFARAESDIAQFDCVAFQAFGDSGSLTATPRAVPITTTNAAAGGVAGFGPLGFAQTSIASGQYGWIALNGTRLRVNVLIGCNPKVPLFTTGTAGKLDDTTVSGGYIQGITLLTSATSASAPTAFVNNPHLGMYAAS